MTREEPETDVIRLYQKAAERNISINALAKKIGITQASLSRKISGQYEFRLPEARAIARVLKLTDDEILEIFFGRGK